jgi:hypothetical protein
MPRLTAKQRAARVKTTARHARSATEVDANADQRRRTVRAAARCGLRHLDCLHDPSRSQAADRRRLAALHLLYELRDDSPPRARRLAPRLARTRPRAPHLSPPRATPRATRIACMRTPTTCTLKTIVRDFRTFAPARRWPRSFVTAGMPRQTAKQRALRLTRAAQLKRNVDDDDDADDRRRTLRAAACGDLQHLDVLHDRPSRLQAADKHRLAALHLLYELRDDDDHACDGSDAVALLPADFANLGNTCFINAATQLLVMHPLLCCLPASEQQGVTLTSCAAMQAALRAALGLRCSHETPLQALARCALHQGFGGTWEIQARCHHSSLHPSTLRRGCRVCVPCYAPHAAPFQTITAVSLEQKDTLSLVDPALRTATRVAYSTSDN